MKRSRKAETTNAEIVLLFSVIVVFIIGSALIISACAEISSTFKSYTEPTTSYKLKVSTPDVATKDSQVIDATKLIETKAPSEKATESETVMVDDATCVEFEEQNYEVDENDYELSEDYTDFDPETYNYSSDVDLLARLICLEAGECSDECQRLVGSTAMNLADMYGSLSAVAYNYDIFNVAYDIDYCIPSSKNYEIAENVIAGDRDYDVKAFKTGGYHDFGTPYTCVDGVYFSTY